MEEPEADALKDMIAQNLKSCTDTTFLDFIYKLILSELASTSPAPGR
jgi:hypothetical protein